MTRVVTRAFAAGSVSVAAVRNNGFRGRLERRNLRLGARHHRKKRRPDLAGSRREDLRLSEIARAENEDADKSTARKSWPEIIVSIDDCADANQRTGAGGATAASVWPLAASALATKPEAFISSMNSRR